jgi:hypothetical protein
VVSITLLCNKPVPTRYRSRLGFLPDIRKHYSQDTAVETSVRSAKRIKKPAVGRARGGGCCSRLAVPAALLSGTATQRRGCPTHVVHALYLTRFRGVVGKLKIAAGRAVPLGYGDIVSIDGI